MRAAIVCAVVICLHTLRAGGLFCDDTFQGGLWALVRHARPEGNWPKVNDDLTGTIAFGMYGTPTSEDDFGIAFAKYLSGTTEFLFATGDYSRWMIVSQKEFSTMAEDWTLPLNITKSWTSNTSYVVQYWHRYVYVEDPWLSSVDHIIGGPEGPEYSMLYGEGGSPYWHYWKAHYNGSNVFIRSAELCAPSPSLPPASAAAASGSSQSALVGTLVPAACVLVIGGLGFGWWWWTKRGKAAKYQGLFADVEDASCDLETPMASSTETIFISYRRSTVSTAFARKLRADLALRGYRVWIDERNIPSGANFVEAIGFAVMRCSAMISLIDKKFILSRYCKNELHMAQTENKYLFPCILEPVDLPADLKFALASVNWTSFDNAPYQEALERLVAGLEIVCIPRNWDHDTHPYLPLDRRHAIVTVLALRFRATHAVPAARRWLLRSVDEDVIELLCYFIGGGTRTIMSRRAAEVEWQSRLPPKSDALYIDLHSTL